MACLQPPCLSSLNPKLSTPKPTLLPKTHSLKPFKISSSAHSSPRPPQNLPTSNGAGAVENGEGGTKKVPERVRIAMERAREYKNKKGLLGAASGEKKIGEVGQNPIGAGAAENGEGGAKKVPERVRIAMERAREYKKNKGLVGSPGGDKKTGEGQVISEVGQNQDEPAIGDGCKETNKIPDRVRIAMEKAREYKRNKGVVGAGGMNSKTVESKVIREGEPTDGGGDEGAKKIPDAVRIEMEKAKEYKKNRSAIDSGGASNKIVESEATTEVTKSPVEPGNGDVGEGTKKIPEAVRIAMEKAREYKKNKGLVGASGGNTKTGESEPTADKSSKRLPAGLAPISDPFSDDDFPEVEIIVGDASKFGNQMPSTPVEQIQEDSVDLYKPKVSTWGVSPTPEDISKAVGGNSGNGFVEEKVDGKEEPLVSSVDFAGLNFSGPSLDDDFPEVEFIVGDASKFGNETTSKPVEQTQEDSVDFYKPKVSTWGVFPRPKDISKAYGGGRTIRPGDVLETAEQRAAKDKRSRRLIAEYLKKAAFSIDPKIKSECEKVLEVGDSLMDAGRLEAALPYYQTVIEKMPFQSELHGLAALHWSICQDSILRHNEARRMYEKLRSHPNAEVSKKAKHFASSFQAVEFLKITRSSYSLPDLNYEKYFRAFVSDQAYYVKPEGVVEEGALAQAFPYFIFILSPIFMVLLLAIQKHNMKVGI